MFDFEAQKRAWSRPPIGGVNTSSAEILKLPDAEFRAWFEGAWDRQYNPNKQPSNWRGLYRLALGLDRPAPPDAVVMDFGCGFGFDALSYAHAGYRVLLADIVRSNLAVAARVISDMGHKTNLLGPVVCSNEEPFFYPPCVVDVYHSSGVLHHTPYARGILERMRDTIAHDGEVRLMLYTDELWRIATGKEPPSYDDMTPEDFATFVRFCDAVGDYADFYTPEKLAELVDGLFTIRSWMPIREDRGYAVAILTPA